MEVKEEVYAYVYDDGVGVYSLSEVKVLKYGMGESSRTDRTKCAPVI